MYLGVTDDETNSISMCKESEGREAFSPLSFLTVTPTSTWTKARAKKRCQEEWRRGGRAFREGGFCWKLFSSFPPSPPGHEPHGTARASECVREVISLGELGQLVRIGKDASAPHLSQKYALSFP